MAYTAMTLNIDQGVEDVTDSEEDSTLAELSSGETLSLTLQGSVYSDAFLAPLVGTYGRSKERRTPFRFSDFLLLLNLVLQTSILYKIGGPNGLVDKAQLNMYKVIYSGGEKPEDGLCSRSKMSLIIGENATKQHMLDGLSAPDHRLINCHPADLYAMYGFGEWLDLNGDGSWSPEEAQETHDKWSTPNSFVDMVFMHQKIRTSLLLFAKVVQSTEQYKNTVAAQHQAEFVVQRLQDADGSIPMDVFESQVQPFYRMCLLLDRDLCGNMVIRKSPYFDRSKFLEPLRKHGLEGMPLAVVATSEFGDLDEMAMVDVCKLSLDNVCDHFLTVAYNQVQSTRREVCGDPVTSTVIERDEHGNALGNVIYSHFALQKAYSVVIMQWEFIIFLALILILWFISMLEEFRKVCSWLSVLLSFIFTPPEDIGENVSCGDDSIEVHHLHALYCVQVLVTNVLPRAVIWMFMMKFGTQFLLTAISYEDLLMNSVALTFLITIDEMVYAAFVPSRRRGWIDMCKPISAPKEHPRMKSLNSCLHHEVIGFVAVVSAVAGVLCYSYREPSRGAMSDAVIDSNRDKAELVECICQFAGIECLAAWRFEGYPTVSASPSLRD